MYSCTDFLRDFSEYRDGEMTAVAHAAAESHLRGCEACTRYIEVVERGVDQLRAIPELEPSEDFLARLQHHIYSVDLERLGPPNRSASGTSTGFVLAVVMLISLSASLPLLRSRPAVVVLPAVVAAAPSRPEAVPSLFREGPLLIDDRSLDVRRLWTSRIARMASWQLSSSSPN